MGVFDFPGLNVFTCTWSPWNNILFQTANSWLFILYVGDFITFTTSFYYMVFLRTVLTCSALFFTLWAVWVLCSPDTAMWNFIFFVYNVIRFTHLLYKEYHTSEVKPRFEKLYNACYKNSGISVTTYNKLIEGGTVAATPLTQSLILHKALYSPDKVLQIISGRVVTKLTNGSQVRLREGDFINHNAWNFSSGLVSTPSFIADYSVDVEGLVIWWSYSRLTEILSGQERRLFSYLLLSNLNKLLLYLSNLIEKTSTLTLDINSNTSQSSEISPAAQGDTQHLLLHQTNHHNNCSSDSCGDSGIENNGVVCVGSRVRNENVSDHNNVSGGNVSDGAVFSSAVSNNLKHAGDSWNAEIIHCENVALLESETTL
ncbi:hypothetical protein ACHWQZ_G014822 [Mnemiopsis leidyi]